MNVTIRHLCSFGIIGFAMGVAPLQADDSESIIKYRQAMMKATGGHMSASSAIVRGKISRKDDLKMHAEALRSLTADIPALFPDDSDFGETEAKEEVWSKRADFEKASEKSKHAVEAFYAAVMSGDDGKIGAAFKDVGGSCKGCHEDFRQDDD